MDNKYKYLNIQDFDYDLPEKRIAKYPVKERDKSKLLIYKNNEISEDLFEKIDTYLPKKSLLVFNDTKVIQARIIFHKDTGAKIEIFCLEPLIPRDYNLSFQQTEKVTWKCITGNLKKWKNASLKKNIIVKEEKVALEARVIKRHENYQEIEFFWNNPSITFAEIIEIAGSTPIPPYLNRQADKLDTIRYQTIYSKIPGSVAAPTAGLHFTKNVFNKLAEVGINKEELTLHVGAGTFQPVKSNTIKHHNMHTEYLSVTKKAIENIIKHKGKVISVGTTSLRSLESLYWTGVKLLKNDIKKNNILELKQWEPYELDGSFSLGDSLDAILDYLKSVNTNILHAKTQMIIVPGYTFKTIDGLITNYHQPKSTLLLLVAAFAGNKWKDIYTYALKNDFRFLSYGDSSLLLK